jgi:putative ABC transport system permease protein
MTLALRELRRRPGAFAPAGLVLVLLASLVLVLGGLGTGLNQGIDGAIRALPGEVVVLSSTAERSVPRSLVTAEQRAVVDATPGVARTGTLQLVPLAARLPDRGPRDLVDVTVVGYELPPAGVLADPPPGTAFADRRLATEGLEEGMTILVGASRRPVTVTGFVSGTAYNGQGTLWMAADEVRALVASAKPDEVLPPGAGQVLVVQTAEGTDPSALATAIDARLGGATETLTRQAAADAVPDVDGGTLDTIVALTLVIAGAVVALFFALLTSERLGLYAVLKAVGARSRTLVAGVVAQAVVLTSLAATAAVGITLLFDRLAPAAIPFAVTTGRVAGSVALLLGTAVLGALFSFRPVVRTDPASALGSAS